MRLDEVLDKLDSFGDDLLLTLDVFCDEVEVLENLINNSDQTIILKMKNNLLTRLTSFLTINPLSVFQDKCVIGVYLKNSSNKLSKPPVPNNYKTIYVKVPLRNLLKLACSRLPKPLALLLAEPFRFIKFGLVGLTGFFVNLIAIYTFYGLLIKFMLNEYATALSSIASFEISLTWNFILHELWTFKDLRLERDLYSRINRWIMFHAGSLGSFVSQVSIVTLLSGYLHQPLYLSLFIGVLIGLIINYVLGRTLAWKSK